MRKSQSATQFLREIVTAQTRRQLIILSVFCFFSLNAFPQADLYVGDGTDDNGSQSYVGTNPIYLSPNIWLLKMPDLNYSPYPFPGTAIPWTINAPDALGNQAVLNKGEYRDPSVFYAPNYVYVKVTNTSTTTDYTGGSFLRVFWAKASLALGWPTNWIDFYANPGGGCSTLFLGEEITKPRRDAAFESVSERNKYRDAILGKVSFLVEIDERFLIIC